MRVLSSKWCRGVAVGVFAWVAASGRPGPSAQAQAAPNSLVTLHQVSHMTILLTSMGQDQQTHLKEEVKDHTDQRWLLHPDGTGGYTIRDPSGSSCLSSASLENYSWIVPAACDSAQSPHRTWRLVHKDAGFQVADAANTLACFHGFTEDAGEVMVWSCSNYTDQVWLPVFEPR
ncbi:RICIN domain-containing protein [Kitasatospora sp. NPDC127116]|uniref:RICIN domain-containing protein n=1 Tax=Kitasatospora sp. NPDC127116 TaxID=3345367 RepID=UPI0036398BF4